LPIDYSKLIQSLHRKYLNNTSPLNKEEYNPGPALDRLSGYLSSQAKLKGAAVSDVDKSSFYVNKDPYNSTNKIQFEEAFRADGIVRRALLRKADFVFAKGIKTVLDTMDDDFDNYEEKQNALNKILGKTAADTLEEGISKEVGKNSYRQAKSQIDKINRKINFRHYARGAYLNCKVYGRSGLSKEYYDSEEGYPTSLYILNPKLMSDVYCDKKTHKIAYVEYNSSQADSYNNKTYYEPKDLIYFTNIDYHISPNTLGYGLSEIEAVKDISETNRSVDERAFKEIAFALWAGIVIFSIPDLHNQEEVTNLLDAWQPGSPMAISSEITATPLEIAHELKDLIELRTQQDKRILRNLGVPSFALGFETDANRATAQFVLHAWKESFVDQERMWLKDVIQEQWIVPLWAKALNMEEDAVYDLDAKLTAEFIDYNFDTFSENVDAWLPLVQQGYISPQDFLDKIGQPELAEKYKELKKELQASGMVPGMGQPQPFNQGFGRKPGVKNDDTEFQGGGDASGESTSLK
jgi:hypothetical protein